MNIECAVTNLPAIAHLRDIYRHEMHCQIIHDSLHVRPGWTTPYLLKVDGAAVGYGAVAHAGPWTDRPTIFEFFVLPAQRHRVFRLFHEFVSVSGTRSVETQTNGTVLGLLVQSFCPSVVAEAILYEDGFSPPIHVPGASVRPATPSDAGTVAARQLDDQAKWVLQLGDEVVGTGGILYHYNRPYGDIFLSIAEPFRGRGLGAFLVQELKRVCYEQGSIPAARCNVDNTASQRTLQKAGFVPCGNIVTGALKAIGSQLGAGLNRRTSAGISSRDHCTWSG
jgi:RimJ/RimL family protein N-acetyltransferase